MRKSTRTQKSRQLPYIYTMVYCQCHSRSAAKKRKRNAEDISQHQPPRKSPRLQKIRHLNEQRVKQAGKWTRSSLETTRTPFCIGRRPSPDKRKSLKAPKKCQLTLYCGCYAAFPQTIPSFHRCCPMLIYTLYPSSQKACPNKRCRR